MRFRLFSRTIALGMALLGATGLARPAAASFIVTIAQQGGNVVATGTGTLNLGALSPCCTSNPPPAEGVTAAVMSMASPRSG